MCQRGALRRQLLLPGLIAQRRRPVVGALGAVRVAAAKHAQHAEKPPLERRVGLEEDVAGRWPDDPRAVVELGEGVGEALGLKALAGAVEAREGHDQGTSAQPAGAARDAAASRGRRGRGAQADGHRAQAITRPG